MASRVPFVVVVTALLLGVTTASITPNPDTWELPPAAPNYAYMAQGLLGTGPLSTLVTVRDPVSTNMAYNTSFFAFSVSGGLVPLNYVQLDAHCFSRIVADVLICDPMSSGPTWPTSFYQLAVAPRSGGGATVSVVSQLDVPQLTGAFGRATPVVVQSTGNIVMAAWNNAMTQLDLWELDRTNSTGQGLQLFHRGAVAAAGVGDGVMSLTMSSGEDKLIVNAFAGQLTLSWPACQVLANATAASYALLGSGAKNIGLQLNWPASSSSGVVYTTYNLATGQAGASSTDATSSFYSWGLDYASSSTPYTQAYGPCLYVAAYATAQKSGVYTMLSQVKVPSTASTAAAVQAQVTLPDSPRGTLVANANYLFVVSQEIMMRWIVQC